ncbi:hypothetical protein BCR34DRAFT_576908 [Clohesyomyces aquaticus]|uniref:Zn(2)-C6 fungal-type domain-containing protein n=1 Tax=Clohesyomyces aquaticus TaxID=1231657 RepID=A0A1Y1YM41_9PLEO|nr:hypothetical protein BCR34DRAFT_576908 [Clohesyomyces aquaticus]
MSVHLAPHSILRPIPAAWPATKPALVATVHQYACLKCRFRRVKCDKVIPACAACAAAGVQCIYSPRKPRKSHKKQHVLAQISLLPVKTESSGTETENSPEEHSWGLHREPDVDEETEVESLAIAIVQEMRKSRDGTASLLSEASQGTLIGEQSMLRYINSDKAKEVRISYLLSI